MEAQNIKWKKGIICGFMGGGVWGIAALGFTLLMGMSVREASIIHDAITFIIAGMVFGIVTGGILCGVEGWFPFRSSILKGVVTSLIIWGVILCGGIVATLVMPSRYHISIREILNGFFLMACLGAIIGFLWERRR